MPADTTPSAGDRYPDGQTFPGQIQMGQVPPGWTPVALSRDIPPATSAGAVCNGAEIVVWRDTAGAVHIWEDRCPHRGMKLSFGFVRGDRIACLYHGWEYDSSAACRYIPAHPELDVPATIRVARYRAVDAGGRVWVAGVDDLDAAPEFGDSVTPLRSLHADAPLLALAELFTAHGLPGRGSVSDVMVAGAEIALTQSGLRLRAGLQPVHGGASALHLVVEGSCPAAALAACIPGTAALRRMAEGVAA